MRRTHLSSMLLAVLALLASTCATDTEPVIGSAPPGENGSEATIPPELEGFARDVVQVNGEPWTVAVADTRELRNQGLMGVEDLGALDGMLFVFAQDTSATFHMSGTLTPLDIAFFTANGRLVSMTQMVPCVTDSCPTYEADSHYRYALEAPAGALIALGPDATLVVSAG